jgi:hypothetical protein
VYCRANLSRTALLVVALLLTAVSTGVFPRELRATDPQGGRHSALAALRSLHPGGLFHVSQLGSEQEQTGTGAIDLDRTNVALIGTMTPLLVWRHRRTERN